MQKHSYLTHWIIGYVMVKNLTYAKANSLNPLYLIIDEVNGYIEESNGNKHLMLVLTDENKDILWKNYEELWKQNENVTLLDQ